MLHANYNLLALFNLFIKHSANGKRTKTSGERIKPQTIETYNNTYKLLQLFSLEQNFELRIKNYQRLPKRERLAEARYWKKFEREFTAYLHNQRNAHDNYTSAVYKHLKTFFNYLNKDRLIDTGPYYKQFKIVKQEVPVTALSREHLLKLIYDKEFKNKLPLHLQRTKDMFVFGCTTALRYSDLMLLKPLNIEQVNGAWYVKIQSKKTKAIQAVKLPGYAADIAMKHYSVKNKFLFPRLSLFNFNLQLKQIGEALGLTQPITKSRSRAGLLQNSRTNTVRFCDTMSSHLMRRTAITNMLTLGMPENLVKHISGHAGDSKSFHRYVAYSQTYMNTELDKVYEKMQLIITN